MRTFAASGVESLFRERGVVGEKKSASGSEGAGDARSGMWRCTRRKRARHPARRYGHARLETACVSPAARLCPMSASS
jgi:hypothetical protein